MLTQLCAFQRVIFPYRPKLVEGDFVQQLWWEDQLRYEYGPYLT